MKLFKPLLLVMGMIPLLHSFAQKKGDKTATLHVGSQGVGADFRYQATPKIGVRGGASFIPVDLKNLGKVGDMSDFDYNTDVSAHFSNAHILADWAPFGGGFRLVAGAGYFFEGKGKMKITPNEKLKFGDMELTPEEVGYTQANITWKGIAPYAGFGFFKAVPKHRFNVSLDLGFYYLPEPEANFTGEGMLKGNESQSGQLQKNVSSYRILPVLQLNLTFKI